MSFYFKNKQSLQIIDKKWQDALDHTILKRYNER